MTLRSRKWIVTSLAGVAAMGAAAAAAITYDLHRSYPSLEVSTDTDDQQARIERGEYVARVGDCVACHTAPEGEPFAGGYGLHTPFGDIYSSNITPDDRTGIGQWSKADFERAVRHGKGSHGYLYPAMPYTAYANMTDQDIDDLWAYLQTISPVNKEVIENQLPFPYNQRWLLAGWNLLFFHGRTVSIDTAQGDTALARGEYLIKGAGHCGTCHSPKNLLGADSGEFLSGGTLQGWHAPDLTTNSHTGLGRWSASQMVTYLKTGANDTSVAAGPMKEAVENSTQYMTRQDLAAMATYLTSLPASRHETPEPVASDSPAMHSGQRIYESQCSACHGPQGKGVAEMIPALAHNGSINAGDPASLIHVVLNGASGAKTADNPTGASMPGFGWKLSDQDIADVLTYIRNSWGNAAQGVTPSSIGDAR